MKKAAEAAFSFSAWNRSIRPLSCPPTDAARNAGCRRGGWGDALAGCVEAHPAHRLRGGRLSHARGFRPW